MIGASKKISFLSIEIALSYLIHQIMVQWVKLVVMEMNIFLLEFNNIRIVYRTDLDDLGFILGLILLPPLALVVILGMVALYFFDSLIITLITVMGSFFAIIYLFQKFNIFSFLADSLRSFLG